MPLPKKKLTNLRVDDCSFVEIYQIETKELIIQWDLSLLNSVQSDLSTQSTRLAGIFFILIV